MHLTPYVSRTYLAGARGSTVRLRDTFQRKLGFLSAPPFPTFLPGDEGWESEDELLSPEAAAPPAAPPDTRKKR